MRRLIFLTATALAACEGEDNRPNPPRPDSPVAQVSMEPNRWTIGPIIQGQNYSIGMSAHPEAHPEGWSIQILPGASPHYVTTLSPPLHDKAVILLSFRHEGSPLIGQGCSAPGTVTAYFRTKDDDWSTDGGRWWASFATVSLEAPGEHHVTIPIDGPWTSVWTMTAASDPARFLQAKRDAAEVGLTFGNCEGLGHGVTAPGPDPARIIVTRFTIK